MATLVVKVTAEVIGWNDLIVKVTWYYKSSGDEGNQNGILTNVTFLFFIFGALRQVKRKRRDKPMLPYQGVEYAATCAACGSCAVCGTTHYPGDLPCGRR